jgi:hypothetical protein
MGSAQVGPLRVAAVFDAVDEGGRPYFSADRRRVLDAAERSALVGYLDSAPLVVRAAGLEVDPLDPAAGRVVPLGYRSDGVWVWQEASAYYLRSRGVAPDEEFVAHIVAAGYRAPESLPDQVIDAAADAAMSPSPVPPASGRRVATYFASVDVGYPPEAPAGLLRQWYDEQGYRKDETLPVNMRWKRTPAFIANARSGEKDFVPIAPELAAAIVDRWWAEEHRVIATAADKPATDAVRQDQDTSAAPGAQGGPRARGGSEMDMFRSAVTVDLAGDVDQTRLDALRSRLRLRPQGRLGDDWDQIFGLRVDDVPGGRVEVMLFRFDTPAPWMVYLNVEGEPSAEALQAVQAEVVEAATESGLIVSGVRRRS